VPEGDTIFRTARTLQRALAGKTVTRFETVLPKLSRIDEDAPLAGRTIDAVRSQGKWLFIELSGNLVLLTHMLMSGSWHIYRPGEPWQRGRSHMRIVIETADILAVAFDVPIAEFHTSETLARRRVVNQLGPDVLGGAFDRATAVANLQSRPDLEIAQALIRQSLLAGLGNVYKSETCFVSGVSPFRAIASMDAVTLHRVIDAADKLLHANTDAGHRRTTGRSNREEELWVYGRAGKPCRNCGTPILSRKQAPDALITFWCPQCQK
jgi:endonuclease-8